MSLYPVMSAIARSSAYSHGFVAAVTVYTHTTAQLRIHVHMCTHATPAHMPHMQAHALARSHTRMHAHTHTRMCIVDTYSVYSGHILTCEHTCTHARAPECGTTKAEGGKGGGRGGEGIA